MPKTPRILYHTQAVYILKLMTILKSVQLLSKTKLYVQTCASPGKILTKLCTWYILL